MCRQSMLLSCCLLSHREPCWFLASLSWASVCLLPFLLEFDLGFRPGAGAPSSSGVVHLKGPCLVPQHSTKTSSATSHSVDELALDLCVLDKNRLQAGHPNIQWRLCQAVSMHNLFGV